MTEKIDAIFADHIREYKRIIFSEVPTAQNPKPLD